MATSPSFDPRHPLKSLTMPRDALRPPSADDPRLGAALSLLAHAGLIAALAIGVNWHTQAPEGVMAELWAAVPEVAAPRVEPAAVEPAPPPPAAATPPQPTAAEREAQIALEKAREAKREQERREEQDRREREKRQREDKERQERARLEREKVQRERDQAEARQREQARLEQQRRDQAAAAREKARQDQLRRISEQLGGTAAPTSTGTAARDAGPSASYAGRIVARIRPNIQLLFEVTGNPTTEVRLIVMPDGTITRSDVVKSSGVKEWDDAVLRAIEKTAVLPRDENGRVPSPMVLSVSRYPKS